MDIKNTALWISSVTARALALAAVLAVPTVAIADLQQDLQTVPEPETLALLGVGAVAMFVARWVRRR